MFKFVLLQEIIITYEYFDLISSRSCTEEYLEIRSGTHSYIDADDIEYICGHKDFQEVYHTYSTAILISLRSSVFKHDGGFAIKLDSVEYCKYHNSSHLLKVFLNIK